MIKDVDDLRQHFPDYLSSDKKEKLADALDSFDSSSSPLYTTQSVEDLLQGDIWSGFEIVEFESGERRWIKGIVLSNSCDVSTDNSRHTPPNIVIAPVVKLSSLRRVLEEHGIEKNSIDSKIQAIERQMVTSIFFLPQAFCLPEPHVVLLDHLHSVPLGVFEKREDRSRVLSLNLLGFYIFIFKLSVHFCRMHENVDRPLD